MRRRLGRGGVLLATVLVVAGCGRSAAPPAGDGPGTSREGAGAILARVDGEAVTATDLDAAIAALPDGEDKLDYTAPGPVRELVDALMDQRLAARAARAARLDEEPAIRAALAALPPDTPAIIRERVLAEAYLDRRPPPAVGDSEVEAYYAAHPAEFTVPPRSRVTRLFAPDGQTARDLRAAAATGQALPALASGRAADGIALASLWVTRRASGTPLEAAVFRFAAGELSEALPCGQGWCVVRVEEVQPARLRPLAEVYAGIRAKLELEAEESRLAAMRSRIREGAEIRVDEAAVAAYRWRGPAAIPDAGREQLQHPPIGKEQQK